MNKRKNDLIQLAILAALGAAVILTLAVPQLSLGGRERRPTETSVVIRESDSALWANARQGMEQAASELGAELRFLTLTPDNDGAEQAGLLLREAESGADVLVTVPADCEELEQELEAVAGSAPVLTLESPLDGAAGTVAPDNAALGKQLAQAVLADWTGGTVLLLNTAPGSAGVCARLQAAQEELTGAGVTVELRTVTAQDLGNVLAQLIEESGAEQAVAFESSATERMAGAKESGGLTAGLYGVGGTAAIAGCLERGTLSAVAAWSDYAAGYLAVEGAVRAARREELSTQPLAFSMIRGEDMYDPDNQKLLFPVTS